MWEGLDNTKLKIDRENCNNLKEEEFIYKRKTWGHMSTKPLPHVIRREKSNFIYIDR